MDRVFRTITHRPIQILILILLPLAIAGAVAYLFPRQYQATATLLALHRYDVLTATSLDNSNLATPAETQTTALSELLQTRSFSLAVAQEANLAETLKAQLRDDPQSRDNALVADISQHVQVQAQGYDLFTITYTGTNPQITQQVVAAVIDNYGQESQLIVGAEGQNLLVTYQTQLTRAEQSTQSAAAAESQYILLHPKLTQIEMQNNPQYQQLHAQTQLAQLNEQNLQASINTLEQDILNHGIVAASLYKVLDAPIVPDQPVSRLKTLLLALGAGAAVAILASTIYIILATRRDRRVYTGLDLQQVTDYPVIMELPRLSSNTVSVLVKLSRRPDSVSSNGRH